MSLKRNMIKGWLTTLIGVATMVITLVLVYRGDMDFVWNGVAGLAIGTVLVIAPKTIEKTFSAMIGKFVPKGTAAKADDVPPAE